MKLKFTGLFPVILLIISFAAKTQTWTPYAYFSINKNVDGKDIYIFTSPVPFNFKCIEGNIYVINPVKIETSAKQTIENKLKDYDPSFRDLFIKQIISGGNTSFEDLQSTNQMINNEMAKLYLALQKQRFRSDPIRIIQIEMGTGRVLMEYSLEATINDYSKYGIAIADAPFK